MAPLPKLPRTIKPKPLPTGLSYVRSPYRMTAAQQLAWENKQKKKGRS